MANSEIWRLRQASACHVCDAELGAVADERSVKALPLGPVEQLHPECDTSCRNRQVARHRRAGRLIA
jgi:hypothetical protein